MKLQVITYKSAVDQYYRRTSLGYRLRIEDEPRSSPERLYRFKNQIRLQTRRNQGKAFGQIMERTYRF